MKTILLLCFVAFLLISPWSAPPVPAEPGGLLNFDGEEWQVMRYDEKVNLIGGYIMGMYMMMHVDNTLYNIGLTAHPLFVDSVGFISQQIDYIYSFEILTDISLASVLFLKDQIIGDIKNGNIHKEDYEQFKKFDTEFKENIGI